MTFCEARDFGCDVDPPELNRYGFACCLFAWLMLLLLLAAMWFLGAFDATDENGESLQDAQVHTRFANSVSVRCHNWGSVETPPLKVSALKATKISGGDADIFSQKGRKTSFLLNTDTMFTDDELTVMSIYRFVERGENKTILGGAFTTKFKRASGLWIVNVPVKETNLNSWHKDKWHDFRSLTHKLPKDSVYRTLPMVRADGPGDDDSGNACMLNAEIAVRYRDLTIPERGGGL